MRNHVSVTFNGREVTVKELTTLELDGLLGKDKVEDAERPMLDRLLARHMVTGDILANATGLSVEEMAKVGPSRLQPVIVKFREVNPDFFEMARFEMDRAKEKDQLSPGQAKEMSEALNKIFDTVSTS